jgi:hypothetical protein
MKKYRYFKPNEGGYIGVRFYRVGEGTEDVYRFDDNGVKTHFPALRFSVLSRVKEGRLIEIEEAEAALL